MTPGVRTHAPRGPPRARCAPAAPASLGAPPAPAPARPGYGPSVARRMRTRFPRTEPSASPARPRPGRGAPERGRRAPARLPVERFNTSTIFRPYPFQSPPCLLDCILSAQVPASYAAGARRVMRVSHTPFCDFLRNPIFLPRPKR